MGWYPHDTASSIGLLSALLGPHLPRIGSQCEGLPVADIGCGDGDYSLLFAKWGFTVDAIDNPATNFNRLQGVTRLRDRLACSSLNVESVDLNARFELPRPDYGLALFLGILYHLQNPYGVLQQLAFQARWCCLSTRIARQTPAAVPLETEPLAYLASGIEIENDATNYWVFSATGLLRLVQRTRWSVWAVQRTGCLDASNPVHRDADERLFLLLQSRVHTPGLQVVPIAGVHPPENAEWAWTAKSFRLQVILPLEQVFREIAFPVHVPDAVTAAGPVAVRIFLDGEPVGHLETSSEFTGEIVCPLSLLAHHHPILVYEVRVQSRFQPPAADARDLGICLPLASGESLSARLA